MATYRFLIPEGAETIDVPVTLSREQARLMTGPMFGLSADEKVETQAAWELLKRACIRALELEGGDVPRQIFPGFGAPPAR